MNSDRLRAPQGVLGRKPAFSRSHFDHPNKHTTVIYLNPPCRYFSRLFKFSLDTLSLGCVAQGRGRKPRSFPCSVNERSKFPACLPCPPPHTDLDFKSIFSYSLRLSEHIRHPPDPRSSILFVFVRLFFPSPQSSLIFGKIRISFKS